VLYFFVLLLDLGVGGFHFTDGGSNYWLAEIVNWL
jgi:hypothetical protein